MRISLRYGTVLQHTGSYDIALLRIVRIRTAPVVGFVTEGYIRALNPSDYPKSSRAHNNVLYLPRFSFANVDPFALLVIVLTVCYW